MSIKWDPDADRIQRWQDGRPIDSRCPHGRSVLLDCPACPDPTHTADEPLWLLIALLASVIAAMYIVVLLIGPGL